MKASPIQLNKFLQKQDTQFVIPIYQRNYDWSEEHCKQLLDDIIEVGKTAKTESKVHFIGSIVYVCNDEYTTEEIEQFVIIDGQQRITTITLFLIALYHFAKTHNDERLAETIYEYYLVNKNALNDNFKIKLKATDNNDRDLQALLDNQQISDDHYSNIKNNYNFFKNQITEENQQVLYEGFKRLLFVEIRLERGKDNAQKIFESLNSTGLDLSQADLIRNYILMGLIPAEQNRLFRIYWSKIEENTKAKDYSYVSDFIRDFLTIKRGEIPNKSKVYQTFKKEYSLENIESIEPVLRELLEYSEIYKFLINPSLIKSEKLKREINYIKYIEINVSYPFILQVFKDFLQNEIDESQFIRILKFVQTYACRRFILDLPTNALNKIFMNLYRQINHDDYENSLYYYILSRTGKVRMPSNIEIQNSLPGKDIYNARSRMKLYILENLENFDNKEFVNIIGNTKITIEHIFPQKPESAWLKELTAVEFRDFSEKYLHTLGNLTFSGNNGALSNKIFIEKKKMNVSSGEQGYNFSRLWLNRFLQQIDNWNIENYKKRSEILSNRFIQIWTLPNIQDFNEESEQNICEVEDPTNKQIEYANFFGKYLPGDKYNGIQLYNYIILELFKIRPEGFIEKFSNILKLTEDKTKLNRAYPLNSTYYFDANLSYATIFSNLKKILEVLDLTDELYIKFRK